MTQSRPDTVVAGRYRLVRRLASGGMGSVWEAWDEVLQRQVALKQLHPQPGLTADETRLAAQRALREARITARLHHQHAVPVYDVVDHEGQPCMIMQFLPSKSLQAVLSEQGPLSVADAARIGSQVASALEAAHRAGVVHRDVKPGNVLIDEHGSAKLTDFGISHALGDATLTSTGMVTGTPAYLAPEVARGQASTAASDVFSLGATLYNAVEGVPPVGSDDNPMATLHRVASGQITPPRRSGELTPLLERMLAVEPTARPPMRDVARALSAIAAAAVNPGPNLPTQRMQPTQRLMGPAPSPVPVAAPTTTEILPPVRAADPDDRSRRNRAALILGSVAVLAILGGLAALLFTGGGGDSGGQPTQVAQRHTSATHSPPPTTRAAPKTHHRSSSAEQHSTPVNQPAPVTDAKALRRAIRDYYALLPDNTDAAWQMLTPNYQNTVGRDSYDGFWASIDRVSTSDVRVTGANTVEATITYDKGDGNVSRELRDFTLVDQGGALLIDQSNIAG